MKFFSITCNFDEAKERKYFPQKFQIISISYYKNGKKNFDGYMNLNEKGREPKWSYKRLRSEISNYR